MKFRFKKIGPIREALMELGDLTVIAGPNNAGKTYLAYTLYGFLKNHDRIIGRMFKRGAADSEILANNRAALRTLPEKGEVRIPYEAAEFRKDRNRELGRAGAFFSHGGIADTFNVPQYQFEEASLSFDLSDVPVPKRIEESIALFSSRIMKNARLTVVYENSELHFSVVMPGVERTNREIPHHIVLGAATTLMTRIYSHPLPSPFILSAERFGVSLFYKELDFTKNRLVEELQKLSDQNQRQRKVEPFLVLERESARYAQPIKDNIDYTRDLELIQKRSGILIDKDGEVLPKEIQKIMGGYYRYRDSEIRFISTARGDRRFDIPLHLASSSARGLSLLYFFLRHTVKPGHLLIIDEPESHLNPANQVVAARLLAHSVNAGLRVLVTTHSDYIVKEFNNLIMLSGNFSGKEKFLNRHKREYGPNDYLNPKSVRAYVCENNTMTKCEVDEQGIEMPVFDKAIDNINKISNELGSLVNKDD